jgi:hypothetical protein
MQYAGPRVVPADYKMLAYPNMIPVPPPTPDQIISEGGPRVSVMGYGGYGDLESAGAGAAVIGIGVAALVLTVGFYVLLAYGIGWGASKGWKRAKKARRRRKK